MKAIILSLLAMIATISAFAQSNSRTLVVYYSRTGNTEAMAMATFLASHNLEGKTVIPFCTHGGGGVDQGFIDVKKLSPKSNHKEGLSLSGSSVNGSKAEIEKWLKEIELIK